MLQRLMELSNLLENLKTSLAKYSVDALVDTTPLLSILDPPARHRHSLSLEGALSDTQALLASIEQFTATLNDARRIHEHRCAIIHNALYVPFHAIPDEIVGDIFSLVIDTTAEDQPSIIPLQAIRLSHICSRTRCIALAETRVWNRIYLPWSRFNTYNFGEKIGDDVKAPIDVWLERCADARLDLWVEKDLGDERIRPILSKARKLCTPRRWPPSDMAKPQHLECLKVHGPNLSLHDWNIIHLRTLVVTRLLGSIDLSESIQSSLRNVALYRPRYTEWLKGLKPLSSIRHFSITEPADFALWIDLNIPQSSWLLPSLLTLYIHFANDIDLDSLLDIISAPSLQHLSIQLADSSSFPPSISPSTVRTIITFLGAVPSLEVLTLATRSNYMQRVGPILIALANEVHSSLSNTSGFLSKLRELQVICDNDEQWAENPSLEGFVDALHTQSTNRSLHGREIRFSTLSSNSEGLFAGRRDWYEGKARNVEVVDYTRFFRHVDPDILDR